MANRTIEQQVVARAVRVLHNGESAAAGEAAVARNLREREQALEVVGAPAVVETVNAGDRILLVDGDRTLLLRGNAVIYNGVAVLEPGGAVLGAHRVGALIMVVTAEGNELLHRTSGGYERLSPADAIPELHLAATERTTLTHVVTQHEFQEQYSAWQAPLATADVQALAALIRSGFTAMQTTAAAAGQYAGVLLARYGVRLWDDSYLWLSQPVIVGNELIKANYRALGEVYTSGGKYAGVGDIALTADAYRLGITVTRGVGESWQSLVKAVDIMVTTAAQVVNTSSLDYRCATSQSSGTRRYILEAGPAPRATAAIASQLLASRWRVVASTTAIATLAAGFTAVGVAQSAQQTLPGRRCDVVTAPMAAAESFSPGEFAALMQAISHRYRAGAAMEHNGRLYHAPATALSVNPWSAVPWLAGTITAASVQATVTVTIATDEGPQLVTTTHSTAFAATALNGLIAFPDTRATHIAVTIGNLKWEGTLSPLAGTGMAACLNSSLQPFTLTTGAIGQAVTPAATPQPCSGRMLVSAVANPLVTEWEAAVTGRRILAMAPACRPIYSGGYGRYPVYLFTDAGIMTLPQSAGGTFGEPRLLAQVVTDSSVTPLLGGDSVWMVTAAGELCALSGSTLRRTGISVASSSCLAWSAVENELWIASPQGEVRVVTPSLRFYVRDEALTHLHSAAGHALAIDAQGRLLNLMSEQPADAVPVEYRSHPIVVDELMRRRVTRVTWNVFTTSAPTGSPAGTLTLSLLGERGSSCHGFLMSRVRAQGIVNAPLSRPVMAPAARSVRLAAEGTLHSGTLLLSTKINSIITRE